MDYKKRSITDVEVSGKKILLRCDFNVPLDKTTGAITDDGRIRATLPTFRYLLKHNAAVIACSHLGRPKGEWKKELSLAVAARRLEELLGVPVQMAADVIGPDARAKAAALKPGQILLRENLRFHREEEKNDPAFAKELASLAELYVTDSFGTAHRAHASTEGVSHYLPSACGFLVAAELAHLNGALNDPVRPFAAILGGSKISDKIGVIDNLLDKTDCILIGGGMAYTFLKASGGSIGASLCEEDRLDDARRMMEKAQKRGVKLVLPADSVAAREFKADAEAKAVPSGAIPDGWMGLDIGPEAAAEYARIIRTAGTVVWNGPMGVFEFDRFAAGTETVARALAESGCISIIGGGDSAAAIRKFGLENSVTHVCTGGGASLEFLEGRVLPGIACIDDK